MNTQAQALPLYEVTELEAHHIDITGPAWSDDEHDGLESPLDFVGIFGVMNLGDIIE